jgi:hypothetical protein
MMMVNRLQAQSERHQSMGGMPEEERERLRREVAAFKEEAEKVSGWRLAQAHRHRATGAR